MDEAYVTSLNINIDKWIDDYRLIADNRVKWELIKYKIRNFTKSYSSAKNKIKNEQNNQMSIELDRLEKLLAESPSEQVQEQYHKLVNDLKLIDEEKINGMIIRSKVQWSEEGEKSSKYFFGLEKQNYSKKTMKKINVNNRIITNHEQIQSEQSQFYKNLYSSHHDRLFEIPEQFFTSETIESLTDDERIFCERALTKDELWKTLQTFKNGKSPGNDGLTFEFYQMFWDKISSTLLKCYQSVNQTGELSSSQRQAVITLIDKKGKDRAFLKNWRPISLLNFDYKLLSKTISFRVTEYLPKLIHHNQSGFVKGRFIGDSIRVLQDIMSYTLEKRLPGLVLFIDFEKAFDTIEWKFIWKALEKYNFGNQLIKWIKVLYNNPEGCVLNNGYTGKYFSLQRGVRQGDPLSPYIFILALELLAVKIREENAIRGFKISQRDIKIALYADDMTLMVKDLASAKTALRIIKDFETSSGLKINIEKCEGLWLGSDRFRTDTPLEIRWTKEPIKVLGIYISYDNAASVKANFDDKIASLLKQLHWWKARKLSFTGKVLIIKALGLSKFALLASLIHIPIKYIAMINTIIYNFLWNGKSDKVKRKIISQSYEHGGIRMLDFNHMIVGAKISWIKRYMDFGNPDWKVLFENFNSKQNLKLFLRCNFSPKDISNKIPDYYTDSLNMWSNLKLKLDENIEDFIWYNKDLKIGNSCLYSESLFKCGLWTVSNLYEEDNKTVIPFKTWLNRGAKHSDFLLWRGLIHAVSKMKITKDKKHGINVGFIKIEKKNILIDCATEKQCKEGIRHMEYEEMKADEFKARKKFETIFGAISHDQWKEMYILPRLCFVNNFIKDIQFKILHRFLPTQSLLYKMKKIASPLCPFCNMVVDDLEHAMYDCLIIKDFWFQVFKLWNTVNQEPYIPDLRLITLGVFVNENPMLSLNSLILMGKAFIFETKLKNCVLQLEYFQAFVKNQMFRNDPNTEKLVSFANYI